MLEIHWQNQFKEPRTYFDSYFKGTVKMAGA